MTFYRKPLGRMLAVFFAIIVLLSAFSGCNINRSLRFDSNYSKFFNATVRTTAEKRLYDSTKGNWTSRSGRIYYLGGGRRGGVPYSVLPEGTELYIEKIYHLTGIDLDNHYALGHLFRNGEKLEFEAYVVGPDELPEWEIVPNN